MDERISEPGCLYKRVNSSTKPHTDTTCRRDVNRDDHDNFDNKSKLRKRCGISYAERTSADWDDGETDDISAEVMYMLALSINDVITV